ncbi:AraC family transcriptional regulator [Mucilaginibacter defluvii]|uniref:Helix-turn-helix transcriptional regulator n=1 Tax=Mucilaginibacter defluvii TaxID=1196019 RepID=A0ABP9FT84_9SPHI
MAEKNNLTLTEFHLHKNQPDKSQFAIFELGDYLEKHGANASKAHIHSFYQIIWFKTGSGKHFVDFKEYEVVDNSVFFIAKNQVHYFDTGSNYTGILIHFNEPFLMGNDGDVAFMVKQNLFNNPYQLPSCCVASQINVLLDDYIRLMKLELSGEPGFGQDELLRSYLKAFLIQVQRRKSTFEKTVDLSVLKVDDKKIQLLRFTDMVEQHYKDGLTVAAYAELMLVSARTLADLTNQFLGKSPSQIIQERIILEAQRMLVHLPLNVNQIGYDLGFEDPSYFVKFFKKHSGMSPLEFRRSIA